MLLLEQLAMISCWQVPTYCIYGPVDADNQSLDDEDVMKERERREIEPRHTRFTWMFAAGKALGKIRLRTWTHHQVLFRGLLLPVGFCIDRCVRQRGNTVSRNEINRIRLVNGLWRTNASITDDSIECRRLHTSTNSLQLSWKNTSRPGKCTRIDVSSN